MHLVMHLMLPSLTAERAGIWCVGQRRTRACWV